ncbi:MAG: hypothetical protein ACXWFB_09415, partial [Nitrososphaeraceae archaeon]
MFKVNYKKLLKCSLLAIVILVICSFSLVSFSPNIFAKDNKEDAKDNKEDAKDNKEDAKDNKEDAKDNKE